MDGAGLQVLLVENDADVRELLMALLTRAGYRVTAAADGEAAWNLLLARRDFDLVLTDYELPVLAGDALIGRRQTWRRAAPAVLMSGHPEVASIARACGADAAYRKGSSIAVLLDTLRRVLPATT
jgi:CheY-like chemotaxis protein